MDWSKHPPFGFKDAKIFAAAYKKIATANCQKFEFAVDISDFKLEETFDAWKFDLNRRKDKFQDQVSSPDHIKCAGYLMHWLRKMSPVNQVTDRFAQYATESERASIVGGLMLVERAENLPVGSTKIESVEQLRILKPELFEDFKKEHGVDLPFYIDHRKRLTCYSNEYLAWDFCYRLARNFEVQKNNENKATLDVVDPSISYIHDFCHLLKYKSVSPQSIAFVLRSILRRVN